MGKFSGNPDQNDKGIQSGSNFTGTYIVACALKPVFSSQSTIPLPNPLPDCGLWLSLVFDCWGGGDACLGSD